MQGQHTAIIFHVLVKVMISFVAVQLLCVVSAKSIVSEWGQFADLSDGI